MQVVHNLSEWALRIGLKKAVEMPRPSSRLNMTRAGTITRATCGHGGSGRDNNLGGGPGGAVGGGRFPAPAAANSARGSFNSNLNFNFNAAPGSRNGSGSAKGVTNNGNGGSPPTHMGVATSAVGVTIKDDVSVPLLDVKNGLIQTTQV